MKLENQVCSLEFAKKLKELGVKQESLWWWQYPIKDEDTEGYENILSNERAETIVGASYYKLVYTDCSAFTVAELGEMLNFGMTKSMAMAKGGWKCDYELVSTKRDRWVTQEADTEVNARAKMLIWLIENKKLEKDK